MKVEIYKRKDLEKAYRKGIKESLETIMNVVEIVLSDKHEMSNNEIAEIDEEVNKYFNEIIDGRITINEIKETVREEISHGKINLSRHES